MADQYNLIVIGAGAVGENVADYAHRGGLSVAIVESALVGGDCSYWACMPSKALLAPGRALRAARDVAGAAQAVTGDLDVPAVLARRDGITSHWDDSSQADWLSSAGIELVRGRGRLTGEREVTVTAEDGSSRVLAARSAVAVCTGSAPSIAPIDGVEEVSVWTSDDATSAAEAPASLAIIGGGVVACELATVYASFGTHVTVLSRSALLASNEDFAGHLVADALGEMGADVRIGARPTSVAAAGGGVSVTMEDGSSVTAERLLMATGRSPGTKDLGLDVVGLTDGDWLDVDDTLRVVGPDGSPVGDGWLYAVGDVNHRALLTHQGKYQARAAGDVIAARAGGTSVEPAPWSRYSATADHRAVPQVTFTDPEVASIGPTEQAARDAGMTVTGVEYDLASVAGSIVESDHPVGRAKLVVDTDRDVVVGATFVGRGVAELLQSATVAVVGEVPLARLWHAVPAYPTVSEVWLRLLDAYGRDSASSDVDGGTGSGS